MSDYVDLVNLYTSLCGELEATNRLSALESVRTLMAQSVSYVWGWRDAKGKMENPETSLPAFGFAYGVVAARHELESTSPRPPIQEAWRSWRHHGEIRGYAFGRDQRLDGPASPIKSLKITR